jgi:hypothetical protein
MQVACLIRYTKPLLRCILLAPFMQAWTAQAIDDCSMRKPLSSVVPGLSRGCPEDKGGDDGADECIRFGNPEHTDGISKYEIRKPGRYCLTQDLHARFDMADHSAEGTMIIIRTSDVILDLQGHTLGRGRIFKNPGGRGISIVDQYQLWKWLASSKNIVIKNGVLQDFDIGVAYDHSRWDNSVDGPAFDKKANTYHFPENNITLENITFKNNKKDFDIRIPSKAAPDNPEYERRRKSQYLPCGGTDDFGRPMGKDQPCDDGK